MNDNTSRKLYLILSILIGIYLIFSFLPPIFLKLGYTNAGNIGYEVYHLFCHQKPERSLYLFGEKSFYNISELSFENEVHYNGYVGDEVYGYKVAICTRDIALYGSFFLVSLFLSIVNKRVKIKNLYLFILILPIFLDIGIQMIFEYTSLKNTYQFYIDNIEKRIVTGTLAGVGVALVLWNSLTDNIKKS